MTKCLIDISQVFYSNGNLQNLIKYHTVRTFTVKKWLQTCRISGCSGRATDIW